MFSYVLPHGGLRSTGYFDNLGVMKFDPPVYEQRYTSVCRILEDQRWNTQVKKVVEYGCAEMRLLLLLRGISSIEHILQVDVNKQLLENNKERAAPFIADYLNKRSAPLQIDIFKGSVSSPVEEVLNADAVICVELIEHLDKEILDLVPANIFGFIRPKLCIMSTPNADVNVLFNGLLPNGFRHDDHRFEWTREEFKTWCLGICEQYPNYKVAIIGVGNVPPEHAELGCVSQMAIFARNDLLDLPLATETSSDGTPCATIAPEPFELIASVNFPYFCDDRTNQQKIMDELNYHIMTQTHSRDDEDDEDEGSMIQRISLNRMIEYAASVNVTEPELRDILAENNIKTEGDFIVILNEEYQPDDTNDVPYDDYMEDDNNIPVEMQSQSPPPENWD